MESKSDDCIDATSPAVLVSRRSARDEDQTNQVSIRVYLWAEGTMHHHRGLEFSHDSRRTGRSFSGAEKRRCIKPTPIRTVRSAMGY